MWSWKFDVNSNIILQNYQIPDIFLIWNLVKCIFIQNDMYIDGNVVECSFQTYPLTKKEVLEWRETCMGWSEKKLWVAFQLVLDWDGQHELYII
jgi:hypothetical protein